MTTSEKYWWILQHPAFLNKDMVSARIEIEPHDVCPHTNRIEDFKALNTKTQLWVEFMSPMYMEDTKQWVQAHDYELDCGGDTYDEAIDKLYQNVVSVYGEYTEEESEEIYKALHPSASNYFSQFANLAWEEKHKWDVSIFDEEGKRCYIHDCKSTKITIEALRLYLNSCTIEQQEEARMHLESEECKLWVLEKSIEKGIDLDL